MTKSEQTRLTAWRLRVLQQAAAEHNVARVCRRFGISRKSFYKWKQRHREHGDAGLCDGRGRHNGRHERPHARWSARSCIYGSAITSGQAESPRICTASMAAPSRAPRCTGSCDGMG